jgi:hypothetical protein
MRPAGALIARRIGMLLWVAAARFADDHGIL